MPPPAEPPAPAPTPEEPPPELPAPPPTPQAPEVAPVPPPAVPVPPATPPPNPDQVFSGRPVPETEQEQQAEHAWFDTGRSFIGRLFFAPVVRLDRFFSDESELDPERAQSFARVRGQLRLRQDGRPTPSGDVLVDLHLPGFEHWLDRFRLVLSSTSDTAAADRFTSDTGNTTPFTVHRTEPLNLELRFGAYRGIRSTVDFGAGILVRYPPGAFTRVRYRLAAPIDDLLVARFSSQVFWRTDLLLGSRLDSALEWPVTPSSVVRLAGTAQVAQRRTRGTEYGAELVYAHAFTPTFALALGTDAQGASRAPVGVDKYRLYSRLRHDVLRRWLFVELEPEVGWPWDPQRGRHRALAIALRLELQFEGRGAVAATAD